MVAAKTRAGRRRVPISGTLREILVEHRLTTGRHDGLIFGRDGRRPFNQSTLLLRARRAWEAHDLSPIGLHECRHTFASLMIAAGVNAKALSTFMGHASITITLDRYGHLLPGSEAEAADLLEAYLTRSLRGPRWQENGETVPRTVPRRASQEHRPRRNRRKSAKATTGVEPVHGGFADDGPVADADGKEDRD